MENYRTNEDGNYQPEIHLPLEGMNHILLGRTLIGVTEQTKEAMDRGVPLAFYSEQAGALCRFFIGRDYRRMEPRGKTDYRIELLERLADMDSVGSEDWGFESIENPSTLFESGRVETAPLFRVWQMSLAPPLREVWIRDYENAPQRGLQKLIEAYVIHQNDESTMSKYLKMDLKRLQADD